MPAYTHRKANFLATLDHLIYNADELEVVQLLDCPDSGVIPNTQFPSDHMRIEVVFQFESL